MSLEYEPSSEPQMRGIDTFYNGKEFLQLDEYKEVSTPTFFFLFITLEPRVE